MGHAAADHALVESDIQDQVLLGARFQPGQLVAPGCLHVDSPAEKELDEGEDRERLSVVEEGAVKLDEPA